MRLLGSRATADSLDRKMAEPATGQTAGVLRPRNLDWRRAAALLYGDWGTSKAYVIGLAFLAAGYASLPIVLAVCVLTGLVGINYAVICRYFPDGGGVYSAARSQGRLLAVVGALLLIADLTVTAALSGWSGLTYVIAGTEDIAFLKFLKDHIAFATIGVLLVLGFTNWFGPKHSGSLAVALALPTVVVVIVLIAFSLPYLTTRFLEPRHESLSALWVQFVGVILALSGVEAIANLTGVMKLDPGSTPEKPSVARESLKAITPVAIEVVVGTALLGWAMLSLPSVLDKTLGLSTKSEVAAALLKRHEDMLRFMGEQFASASFGVWFGQAFGWIVGIVFLFLLLSAANTAIVAMIGLLYMTARDGEMPPQFKRQGITTLVVTRQVAEMVSPTLGATMRPRLEEGQRIMVAARGITPVLSYALDEAQLRKASLYVVYVKELAVYYGAGPMQATRAKWQGDPEANAILSLMLKLGSERDVPVMPVYAVSEDPAATILDLAATIGVDYLMLGTSHRRTLANLLRGNVVTNIADQLPDTIRLVIYG